MLNSKWFFLNTKVSTYTNVVAPTNHVYVSSSQAAANTYFNSFESTSPLEITACDRNNNQVIDLITAEKATVSHILWADSALSSVTLDCRGLLWGFREVKEFFGLQSLQVEDSRNLLLDYSITTTPLKKVFPVQGVEEVYFNFYTQQVQFSAINSIEL